MNSDGIRSKKTNISGGVPDPVSDPTLTTQSIYSTHSSQYKTQYKPDSYSYNNLYNARKKPILTSTKDSVYWRHMQSFGDDGTNDDDLITSLTFDSTGNYIAVGDKAGRVCLFEASTMGDSHRDKVTQCLELDLDIAHPNRLLSKSRRRMLGLMPETFQDMRDNLHRLVNFPIGSELSPEVYYQVYYDSENSSILDDGYNTPLMCAFRERQRKRDGHNSETEMHDDRDRKYDDPDVNHDDDDDDFETYHDSHNSKKNFDPNNPDAHRNSSLINSKNDPRVPASRPPTDPLSDPRVHTRLRTRLLHPPVDLSQVNIDTVARGLDYRFYTEYQAHDHDFDPLKSQEIEPKITGLCWFTSTPSSQYLLSSNDKTIKLWKVSDKQVRVKPVQQRHVNHGNIMNGVGTHGSPLFSPTTHLHTVTTATEKKCYRGAHSYHLNSVSACADGELFMSSDDLVVNMWHVEHSDQPYPTLTIKPPQLEEVTEVITRTLAHPTHASLFGVAISRGNVRVYDQRIHASCSPLSFAKSFEQPEEPLHKTFFSEIVHCTSDLKFSPDGKHVISRDYFNVYVWDMAMDNKPVETIPVHPYLRAHMSNLYENDCLFDLFRVDVSSDGKQIISGGYHNQFLIHNLHTNTTTQHEAGAPNAGIVISKNNDPFSNQPNIQHQPMVPMNKIQFNKKALYCAFHPQLDVTAVAGMNKLYVYQAIKTSDNNML